MLHASKRLGQHFLVSRPVLRKIVAAADLQPSDTVLEIGPGLGALTTALARRAERVIAVEKDAHLANMLEPRLERAGITNVTLITGDILKIPLSDLNLPDPYRVVANIPYYLTSRLIRRFLESNPPPASMLLMVQREVAERIAARPPRMNLLALSVQAYGRPTIIAAVRAGAFSPRPGVQSAILEISEISTRFFAAHHISPAELFAVARAAFNQRRKLLANSLQRLAAGKTGALAAIKTAGLAKSARPEELSLEEWARLTRTLAAS